MGDDIYKKSYQKYSANCSIDVFLLFLKKFMIFAEHISCLARSECDDTGQKMLGIKADFSEA